MSDVPNSRPATVAQWQARLSRWQSADCSVTEFCRRERVSVPSFYGWRTRLAAANPRQAKRRQPKFVPVEILANRIGLSVTSWECELVVGPLICRVPRGTDEAALRRVVRILHEEAASC